MSYDFVKTYQLKAHTPLIHFQHMQSGATLRATEVKPKLDKFLWDNYGDRIDAGWKMKADQKALNYKIHIVADGPQNIVDIGPRTDYEIFYGNTGVAREQQKRGIKGDAVMTVTCVIPELFQLIDESIVKFFIVHNFGTMQNKGFGSYTVEGHSRVTPADIMNSLKEHNNAAKCYFFPVNDGKPFEKIKIIYGMMKSGVNYTRFQGPRAYQRSLLFLFMHDAEKGNEKAWLKQSGMAPANVGSHARDYHRNPSEHKAYYVRALLGIGDHIDFLNDLANPRDKTHVQIKPPEGMERFSSPVFFKVVGNNVYFVAKRIGKEIYGKTFRFSSSNGRSGALTVPTEAELGSDFVDRFLEYSVKEMNSGALKKFSATQSVMIGGR